MALVKILPWRRVFSNVPHLVISSIHWLYMLTDHLMQRCRVTGGRDETRRREGNYPSFCVRHGKSLKLDSNIKCYFSQKYLRWISKGPNREWVLKNRNKVFTMSPNQRKNWQGCLEYFLSSLIIAFGVIKNKK